MTLIELLAELDALATLAAKFATVEPEFVARLNAAFAQVKTMVPASTLKGLEAGLQADASKVVDFFNHKRKPSA